MRNNGKGLEREITAWNSIAATQKYNAKEHDVFNSVKISTIRSVVEIGTIISIPLTQAIQQ